MFARCSIRYKLLIGVALLFLIVVVLSTSGIWGVNSYRLLARTVSQRAAELPIAADVSRHAAELKFTFSRMRPPRDVGDTGPHMGAIQLEFNNKLGELRDSLRNYQRQLDQNEPNGRGIGDDRKERKTVGEIRRSLDRIDQLNQPEDWVLERLPKDELQAELDLLERSARSLPKGIQQRMLDLRGNARGEYHTLLGLTWTTSILAGAMLIVLVIVSYEWVVRPLRAIIHGSRRVASGDFSHQIKLPSQDEMAELAMAMNDMTARFREIRDDLDQQVKQRTKEVVRGEQLASVGFLAAGVAHEINNPLASIAWCAESLESRLHDIIYHDDLKADHEHNPEIDVLRNYLRRIQDEAFRCKGITEKLLDFSRIGDVQRTQTDLRELVSDIIDMIKHLGRYKHKKVLFDGRDRVMAEVNPQEIKQVLLNLLTNALDSVDADGLVAVELGTYRQQARLIVRDNGCGMTPEVREHLFEPFFTRRRDGQGTGLGLSISYRIVTDHGGGIEVSSDGPGAGSEFRVTLPLASSQQEKDNRHERRPQVA